MGSYGATIIYVGPCQIKYLFYGYRLQDLDHGVVNSLHKPCLALGSINTGFENPLYGIEINVLANSKKLEVRKKYFFSKTKKRRGKKNMLCEV